MTTIEKITKTYVLAHGIACLGGAGRATNLWGSHVTGSLWDALHDPHFLDKHAGEFRPGDRLYLCSFADAAAFRLDVRSEIASVVILRVKRPMMAADGTKVAGSVWFNQLDYFSLAPDAIRGYELPQPEEVAA